MAEVARIIQRTAMMQHYMQLRDMTDTMTTYIRSVLAGEEIVVLDRDEPVARITAVHGARKLSPAQQAARERTRERMKRGYALGLVGIKRDSLYE